MRKTAMPIKCLCTFTENTELGGSEDHLERKQVTGSTQKASEKHFQIFLHTGDGRKDSFKNAF